MKFCNNCQSYRESWKDKGYSGSNYENRCYACDKYTLSSSGELAQKTTNSVNSRLNEAYNKPSASNVVTVGGQVGNWRTHERRDESLTVNKETGDYEYNYFIEYPPKK